MKHRYLNFLFLSFFLSLNPTSLNVDLTKKLIPQQSIVDIATIAAQQNLSKLSLTFRTTPHHVCWEQAALSILLANRPNLKMLGLDLSWNELGAEGMVSIVNALALLTGLEELVMTFPFNKLGDTGAWYVATGLKKLTKIKRLSLNIRNNRIEIEGVEDIVNAILKLPKLEEVSLDLRWNKFYKKPLQKCLFNMQETLEANGVIATIVI